MKIPFKGVAAMILSVLLGAAAPLRAQAQTQDASPLLRQEKFQQLNIEFWGVQQQFERGEISGDLARNAFRAFYPTDADLAEKYDKWVAAFPKSYVARLARAIYFKKRGFDERGGNYISETSQAQLDKMDHSMTRAIKDFGDSIPMTSKPFLSYLHMLDISSSYTSTSNSRSLYDHAIALDPSSLAARQKYMLALSTKWGGSHEEMQAFLGECREAKLPEAQFQQLESMVYEDDAWAKENSGDFPAAEVAYRKAIELGVADCTSCLASGLVNVLIKERKFTEAVPYLDRYLIAKPGDVWALWTRGIARFESGDTAGAFADWTQSASTGDAASQNRVGVMYLTGIPGRLTADRGLGIEWLKKAAAQGDANAVRNLQLAFAQQNSGNPPLQ